MKQFIRSKLFIGIAAAAAVIAAAVITLILVLRPDSYRVIKVFELIGSGSVLRRSLGELEPYKGMNLESGDKVSTHRDSSMMITLDETKYVFMEQETYMELVASGDAKKNKTRVLLGEGAVLSELTRPLLNSSYEVTAPKASFAVYGTSFRVHVAKDGQGNYIITVQVFHGTVNITLLDEKDSPATEASLTEGKTAVIKTVRKENSDNDPAVDGRSFFVLSEDGTYKELPQGADPAFDADYFSVPFETLKKIYDADESGELKLLDSVREKVIEAMNGSGETQTGGALTNEDSSGVSSEQPAVPPNASSSLAESTADSSHITDSSSTESKASDSSLPKESISVSDSSSVSDNSRNDSSVSSLAESSSQADPNESSSVSESSSAADTSLPDSSIPHEESSLLTEDSSLPENDHSSAADSSSQSYIYRPPSDVNSSLSDNSSYIDPQNGDTFTVRFLDRNGRVIVTAYVERGGSVDAPQRGFETSYTDADGTVYEFDGWDADLTNVQSDMRVMPRYRAVRYYIEDPSSFYFNNNYPAQNRTVGLPS